jgi:hypothetical protein
MAIFHDQDWQSMQHKKAKPYQEHEQMTSYPKPHQKPKQFPKPHQKDEWIQPELPFTDKDWSSDKYLTDTEIEELFWRKLVQLGWRWQTYGENLKSRNIVLPCPYCNLLMDSHTIITESNSKRMQDKYYCEQVLKRHKGLECKAILEDEAIPEAIPEACYKCQGEGILQSGEECNC